MAQQARCAAPGRQIGGVPGEAISGDASPIAANATGVSTHGPTRDPVASEPEEVFEPDPPPTDAMKARELNRTLMSRFGHDTRAMLVMEFICEERLFERLNVFLKKRLR
jgi:hypothetical protein